jgi:hypothetical protein
VPFRRVIAELEKQAPEFVADCAKKGVRYSNVMPDIDDSESGQGRSWRSTLSTDKRDYCCITGNTGNPKRPTSIF